MPTNNIAPLLGKHTKLFTIQGATVNEATGDWTLLGTAQTVQAYSTGYLNNFEFDLQNEMEVVQGYASTIGHEVQLSQSFSLGLGEIMRVASPQSIIESFLCGDNVLSQGTTPATHFYVLEQMIKVDGGATARKREFWGVVRGHNWARAHGRNVYTLALGPVNIGSANPLITVSV